MKQQVFAVFDSRLGAYMVPFYAPSIGVAVRMFSDACGDANSALAKHPEDYTLMHLGEWNDDTGAFKNMQVPVNLGLAVQYRKPDGPAPSILKEGDLDGRN